MQITKPIITIIAEERGPFVSGEFHWSFGSNSEGNSHSKVGYVMMKNGKILAISLSAAQRNINSEERVAVGVTVGGAYQDGYDITKNPGYYSDERTFERPLEVKTDDIINFQSRKSTRTFSSGVVALLVELEM